jgi:beta-glucanase (GH16 family)
MITVSAGMVRYYVDGECIAAHDGKYYPESKMCIDFSLWFIDKLNQPDQRIYVQDVDWVCAVKDRVLTNSEIQAKVQELRSQSVKRIDMIN